MSSLDRIELPFPTLDHQGSGAPVVQSERDALLDVAFNSYPATWEQEAYAYVLANEDFLTRHHITIPKAAKGEEAFDPEETAEILAMNMVHRREVISEIREALSEHGRYYYGKINTASNDAAPYF